MTAPIDTFASVSVEDALTEGRTAAACAQWSVAASHFAAAVAAAERESAGAPSPALGAALSNAGQALARCGRWGDAERALRRAAEVREALVTDGIAAPAVATRGWSDLAALLAATGPEDPAREAHARAAAGPASPAVQEALDETAQLLGIGADAVPEPAPVAFATPAPAEVATFDLSEPDEASATLERLAAEAVAAEDATDAAAEAPQAMPWLLTQDAATDAGDHDEEESLEVEVLLPDASMDALMGEAAAAAHAAAVPGGRLAAVDAIVAMTEQAPPPKRSGFLSLLRKVTRR